MAAYRWVSDSCHLQADCQEPGSAPEPYARQSSMGYLYLFLHHCTSDFDTVSSCWIADDVDPYVIVVAEVATDRLTSLVTLGVYSLLFYVFLVVFIKSR